MHRGCRRPAGDGMRNQTSPWIIAKTEILIYVSEPLRGHGGAPGHSLGASPRRSRHEGVNWTRRIAIASSLAVAAQPSLGDCRGRLGTFSVVGAYTYWVER
jgi:hypothetical protein